MKLSRPVLCGFLVVVALASGIAGWRAMRGSAPARPATDFGALIAPSAPQAPPLLASIEKRIAEAPDYAGFLAGFRQGFPADYSATFDEFARRASLSAKMETPDAYVTEAVAALRRARGLLAAKAGGPALDALFDAQSKTVAALAEANPKLCVAFLYGATGPDFEAFAQGHRRTVARLADATLAAIVDGQQQRIGRPAPAERDFQQIEANLLARGLTGEEVSALLDGRAPDPPLPDERMCRAGLTYLEVLQKLPDATRAAIYSLSVELMTRS